MIFLLLILVFIVGLYRMYVKRKEIYALWEKYWNRFVVVKYKGEEIPMRYEEAVAFQNSKGATKRGIYKKFIGHKRKGRIKEVYTEEGDKAVTPTEKMKYYRK